jgi:hypothetical protein
MIMTTSFQMRICAVGFLCTGMCVKSVLVLLTVGCCMKCSAGLALKAAACHLVLGAMWERGLGIWAMVKFPVGCVLWWCALGQPSLNLRTLGGHHHRGVFHMSCHAWEVCAVCIRFTLEASLYFRPRARQHGYF